jgi:ABC-type branched-subunit amino acid transport system substrate-binding protein
MILAQNRLPQLNGNKILALLVLPIVMISCGAFKKTTGNDRVPVEEEVVVVEPKKNEGEAETPEVLPKKEEVKTKYSTVLYRGEKFRVPVHKKNFEIAVLLPFHITGSNSFQDKRRAGYMLEYYQGMKLAIAKAENLESSFKIKFYDTDNDSLRLKSILRKKELKNADLIIGPTDEGQVKIASHFAKRHKIPLFSPITTVEKYWSNNPYAFNLRPSQTMQAKSFIEFYQTLHSDKKLIIVRDGKKFDKSFGAALVAQLQAQGIPFEKLAYNTATNWETLLDEHNLVLNMAQDKTTMTNLVNILLGFEDRVTLVGSDKWLDFSSVDFNYWERLHIHFISENSAIIPNEEAKAMTYNYRLQYRDDPSWFAYRGYDQLLFACEALDAFGEFFPLFLENKSISYTNSDFCITKTNNCFHNKYINVFKYEEKEVVPVSFH